LIIVGGLLLLFSIPALAILRRCGLSIKAPSNDTENYFCYLYRHTTDAPPPPESQPTEDII
jgi:hypothetical protein